jgi:hypothetical protein
MTQRCRTCSRANPDEALYCHHDGTALDDRPGLARPVAVGRRPFVSPFVFPSGRTCRNFDELALACEDDWPGARDMLRKGYLESFLAAIGRGDLAVAARQAAGSRDPDLGLDELLGKLPGDGRQPPRLRVQPAAVNLGRLTRGEDRPFLLRLENQGMGLLAGTVTVEGAPWLVLGEGRGSPRKVFQCRHDFPLPVQVHGKSLRAGLLPCEGRLSIVSTGGSLVVTVRCEVPIAPFPHGVLAGARSPRELAGKARGSPREAAPLFQKGAVAAWYESNGWTYPVQGPPAAGLGAVQQFFEALGLVTPPKVEISESTVYLQGPPGATLEHVLQVQAQEARPVFAHATTGVPWLKIGRIHFGGRTARIPLRIPAVPDRPAELLLGKVLVQANGSQRFVVDVTLQVLGTPGRIPLRPVPVATAARPAAVPAIPVALLAPSQAALAPMAILVPPVPVPVVQEVPVAVLPGSCGAAVPAVGLQASRLHLNGRHELAPILDVLPADPVPPRPAPPRRSRKHLLPIAFLAIGLLVPLVRDLIVGLRPGAASTEEPADNRPRIALAFHDLPLDVTLGDSGVKPGDGEEEERGRIPAVWEPSMRFGLVLLEADGRPAAGRPRRLTFEEHGLTNNTCVRLDGNEWLFGERPFRRGDGRVPHDWPGRWKARDVALPSGRGRQSVWVYDAQDVEVAQTVEIVRGPQSGLLDTCLVRYRLANHDRRPHRVGLRFLLDTYIGGNDGAPFLIPGRSQLCSTSMAFRRPAEVPDFIQALEKEDLTHPGTIAHLQLRPGGGLEAPGRVTLGAWPNPRLAGRDPRCEQEKTLWDVPVLPIRSLTPADSAVAIYWDERDLPPGGAREVGFTYGLGSVSSGEGGGKLAVTLGGAFAPRGEFTVTAYVSNPVPGQKVTLSLPPDFELLEGTDQQAVPPLPAGAASRNSPVTWRVRAGTREGTYTIKVQSSTGVSQTQEVRIKVKGIFGN